jgi:hypothetical protein
MNSLKKTARLAGLVYLISILTGIYSIFYIPSRIMVPGDAVTTARNILSNEFLFRTGIISDIISSTLFLLLVFILYLLLKGVDENKAKLMLVLVIVQTPLLFFVESFNLSALMILKGEILKTFEFTQRQELAMLLLNINEYGTPVIEVFWGIWLIPFGQLVYKSRFIPSIFGVLLIIAGIAYVADSFILILFPDYHTFVKTPVIVLGAIGEFSIMLWFLIKGVKDKLINATNEARK